MNNLDIDLLITRYLNNELTEAEVQELKEHPEFAMYKDIVTVMDEIEMPAYDENAAFEKLKRKTSNKQEKRISYRPHIRFAVAASVVLLMGLGIYQLFFKGNPEKQFQTAIAEKQVIELPDGSTVHMNASSDIEYNEKKWKKKRSITLNGEAFFDVKKGENFVVSTTMGTVEVLGTSFNIKSRNKIFEVVCYTGKVHVISGATQKVLLPGKAIRITKSKPKQWKSDQKEPAWISGVTELDDVTVAEAIDELKRQFDISVTPFERTDTITVDFPNDDPEVAIEQVLLPLNIEYEYDAKKQKLIILDK